MDNMYATTLAYLAFAVLVLLLASFVLRKDLNNVSGALTQGIIGILAATIVAFPVHDFGVAGTLDAISYWLHTAPLVGRLLVGSFAVSLVVPVPCFVRAYHLARNSIAARRLRTRAAARLDQLRSSH